MMKRRLALLLAATFVATSVVMPVGAVSFEGIESAGEAEIAAEAEQSYASLAAETTVYVDAGSSHAVTIGSETSTYTFDAGTTKATFNGATKTVTGAGYAGTATVTADDTGDIETIVFCGATKWRPGYNVLTGSTEGFSVDGAGGAEKYGLTFRTDDRGFSEVIADPANAEKNVIRIYSETSKYPLTIMKNNMTDAITTDRKVLATFSYKGTMTNLWIMANTRSSADIQATIVDTMTVANWTKAKFDAVPLKNVQAFGVEGGTTATNNIYIDDISFIPYYKVTYVMPDETTQSEQVLTDASGAFLTSYTPKSDNLSDPGYIGWSTTENATVPMDSVALAGDDITLYPVFGGYEVIAADEAVMSATGTLAVEKLSDNITWSFDAGNSEATFDEATATITGAGYAGVVKVTATDSVKNVTEIKTVRLYGATQWMKPGLNILTGTNEAFTAEGDNGAAAYALTFATDSKGFSEVTADPLNENRNIIRIYSTAADNAYPLTIMTKDLASPITTDRNIAITYDYLGAPKNLWTMINTRSSTDIHYTIKENTTQATAWTPVSSFLKPKNAVKLIGVEGVTNSTGSIYLTNLRFIPAYKIDYMSISDPTVIAYTDYVALDENGKVLTSYVPDTSKVPGATGYALTQGGEKVIVVALENKDITLYPLTTRDVNFTDGTNGGAQALPATEDYTIPMPSEVSSELSDTNFVAWTDADGNVYSAGSVVAQADIDSKLYGKILTAYYQDASKPAMGLSNEGDAQPGEFDRKYSYAELLQEDGRNVLHSNQYASSWDASGKVWKSDPRLHFKLSAAIDPNEYSIFQYMYKANNFKNVNNTAQQTIDPATDTTDSATADIRIFYYTTSAANGYYAGGDQFVGNKIWKATSSNEYTMMEVDMSNPANSLPAHPWTKTGAIWGIAIDPARASYSSDVYIDYIRIYRAGITTVTYNTNAPAGATVLKDVSADTGRGVGKGYLLKGEYPEVDGYVFLGWALTPDAAKSDVVGSIDLTGDTTVYAVWGDAAVHADGVYVPDSASIRSAADGKNGIRFRGEIAGESREVVEEYGFIIARETVLTANGSPELTFDFKKKGENTPLYVVGKSYDKSEGIDIQYEVTEFGDVVFTAVCINIPSAYYNEKLVARSYVKYTNGLGLSHVVYGDTVIRSIAEVAQTIKDAGGADYESNKAYIDSILG